MTVLLCLFLPWEQVAGATLQGSGRGRNFVVPATDAQGNKSVVRGEEFEPGQGGALRLTGVRIETFKEGEPDLVVRTEHCLYHNSERRAHSSGRLEVETADGRMRLEGEGFFWDQNQSLLIISNAVQAVIQESVLAEQIQDEQADQDDRGGVGAGKTRVQSDQFRYGGSMILFEGKVYAEQDEGAEVWCERLKVEFGESADESGGGLERVIAEGAVRIVQGEAEATGAKAIYEKAKETMRLEGQPSWRVGEKEGRSEVLVLERRSRRMRAEGKVWMRLPYREMAPMKLGQDQDEEIDSGVERGEVDLVEVEAAEFVYEPQLALFSGDVVVRSGAGRMTCDQLVVMSDISDRVERVEAEGKVRLVEGTREVRGARAVYLAADDSLRVTGEPEWALDETKGRSEVLLIYPERQRFLAVGQVRVDVPVPATVGDTPSADILRLEKEGGRPGLGPGAEGEVATVVADELESLEETIHFRGNVKVKRAAGDLRADEVVLRREKGEVKEILARGGVKFSDEELRGAAEEVLFDVKHDVLVMRGKPQLRMRDRNVAGEQIRVDRQRGTFEVSGQYRVDLQLEAFQKERGAK